MPTLCGFRLTRDYNYHVERFDKNEVQRCIQRLPKTVRNKDVTKT